MSEQKGKMVTCARDDNFVFLKLIGKGEADGGYTVWDKFEPLPDNWLFDMDFGYLCPACAMKFKTFVNEFFDGKVSDKWKLKDGECDGD